MYRILYGNHVLHDPRDEDRILTGAKAELAVNDSGKLEFTLQRSHPMHGKLAPMNRGEEVVLESDGVELFRGRIVSMEEGFGGGQEVVCEGELAYLNDVVLRPYSTTSGDVPSSVDGYFAWMVNEYNQRTEQKYRFVVGINQGYELDHNNYILRENVNRPNIGQEMKEKLLQKLGGYVRIRHANGLRYIDYIATGDSAATQRIEFGENLLDFTHERDWTEYCTAVVPVGASDGDSDQGVSKKLNILGEPDSELAGGLRKEGDRIFDVEAARKHGYIEQTVEFDDITIVGNLVQSGARWLRNVQVGDTLTMTAVDMSLIDPDVKPIYIGDFVRATSRPHGFDEYFVCSKLTVDVSNPADNKFVLGNEYDYMTGMQSAKLAALNSSINKVYEETEKIDQAAKDAAVKADEAKDAADVAQSDAGLANATASEAQKRADAAKTAAESAADEAIDAKAAAADADAKATLAQTSATEAKSTADAANEAAGVSGAAANAAQEAAGAAQATADAAAKTATSVAEITTDGVTFGNKLSGVWSGFRSRMAAGAFQVLDAGGNVLSSFGASVVELGKNSVNSIIKLCGGKGEVSYGTIDIYGSSYGALRIASEDIVNVEGSELVCHGDRVHVGNVKNTPSDPAQYCGLQVTPNGSAIVSGYAATVGSATKVYLSSDKNLPVKINGNDMVDFVVASGTSGEWTYRKWASGVAECWCAHYTAVQINIAWSNGWYRSDFYNDLAFPFTFAAVPSVIRTCRTSNASYYGDGNFVCSYKPATTTTTGLMFFGRNGGSPEACLMYLDHYVVGRWK